MSQTSSPTFFSKLYHFICIIIFTLFYTWDRFTSPYTIFRNFLFLTFITFHLTWLYFTLSFLNDINGLSYFSKKKLDKLFNIVTAFSLTTFAIFWIMHLQDPKSMLREGVEIPLPLNLFLHGGVHVVNLLEQVVFNPRKTNNKVSKIFFVVFLVIYSCFLRFVFLSTGHAIYPFCSKPIGEFSITIFNAILITLVGDQIYVYLSNPGLLDINKEK